MKCTRRIINVMLTTSCAVLLAGGVNHARATVPGCEVNEFTKLTASDGAPGDEFGGFRVAICADTAVIGAYYSDDNGADSGSAYVFRFDGSSWDEEAKLLPSDGAAVDLFGSCVGCSGDIAVVGAFGDDGNGDWSGSAYVFRRYEGSYPCPMGTECTECEGVDPPTCVAGVCEGACWIEEAKLLASEPTEYAHFGRECPMSGDTIVVGAHSPDGAVYFFQKPSTGWENMTETQKLTPSDGAANDHFGVSVGIAGDALVIGAVYNDDACPEDPLCNSGSAYVFERDDNETPSDPTDDFWVEKAKLLASDGARGDWFGVGVGISGDTAIIGAPLQHKQGSHSGSAYVFERPATGWANMTETQKLLASDGAVGHEFGGCVAISADTALVAAHADNENGPGSGSAYVFQRDDNETPSDPSDDFWVESAKLLASDGAPGDNFGWPVAISDDTAFIGAFLDDNENGTDAGRVYVFHGLSDGIPDECGACCGPGPCIQVTQTECDTLHWSYRGDGTTCEEEDCDNIPAVSEWGLVVLTLLVLAAGSIVITRRRVAIA